MVDAIEITLSLIAFVLLIWFLASIQDVNRSVEALISGCLLVLCVVGLLCYISKRK